MMRCIKWHPISIASVGSSAIRMGWTRKSIATAIVALGIVALIRSTRVMLVAIIWRLGHRITLIAVSIRVISMRRYR